MSDVKRYVNWCAVSHGHRLSEAPDGLYVTFADYDALRAELDRLHSWDGLMELLDEHWPADIFTGESGDPGPRMIVAMREIDRLRAELAALREAAGKVMCATCNGRGRTFLDLEPCPDCANLRKLLGEKP